MLKKLYRRLGIIYFVSIALIAMLFLVSLYERSRKENGQYMEQLLDGIEMNLQSVSEDYEEKIRILEKDYLNRAWAVEYILSSSSQMISAEELDIVKELMEVQGITVTDRRGNVVVAAGSRAEVSEEAGLAWPDGGRVVIENAEFYHAPSYFYVEVESDSPVFAAVRLDAPVSKLGLMSRKEMIDNTLNQATTEEATLLAAVEKENGQMIGITKNNAQEMKIEGADTEQELLQLLDKAKEEGLQIWKMNGEYHMGIVREQEGTYFVAATRMGRLIGTMGRTVLEGLAGIVLVGILTMIIIHGHLKKYMFGQVGMMRKDLQRIMEGKDPWPDDSDSMETMPELKPLAETIRKLGRDYVNKREGFSRMEDQLTAARSEARFDQLTGLYNRSGFERCAEEFLNGEKTGGVLVLFDLDNFKKINDSEGHPEGDQVLVRFAQCLLSSFRKSDYIGRLGGDEFAVLMPGAIKRELLEIKFQKLLENVRTALAAYYEKYHVSVSMGAVPVDGEIKSYDGLYRCADTALYIAKYLGKDQYYINDRKISCMRRECIGCRQDCPRSEILRRL